ncbi:MAG: hydantoinase/oxoprolinase family protein [Deltaproteobacteria bacterium]|nr:hydantoinase/oxoprolinase family protein [Deltaproteobacteria bacterium]
MPYVVAVDIGGTFTDLVAFDHETGDATYSKSPTTYGNFVDGILECFEKRDLAPSAANFLNHGTTLVINSLIQRRGAKCALVTSEGFRDVLEIARANRPDPFDLHYQRDEPLIPRELRFEVPERVDAKGEVLTPLDAGRVEAVAEELKRLEIEAVAVFFMSSYLDPSHEERAADILKRLLPGVYVTCSTELTREWYEYERTSTVAANAYVGPQVNAYVRRLESDFRDRGYAGSLFMMGSNGGLLSVDRTCRQPIGLVESGPIGGCIGAGAYAEALGIENVVAFDMGGTTAKCALVENGRFTVESVYYVNGYVKGFPIKWPVIDIVEVGSGGGSIAWLDDQNRLHVGPQSAGSTPGPVCYQRGGTEPTVTDANLVLGRLNPHRFLGGELSLGLDAARRTIAERTTTPLGYQGEEGLIRTAGGIVSIATVLMAGAIRQVSVEHGLDPRDFVLFAYGGGGPLHASALARELSIPSVVIPPEPGNFSAVGMLLADARVDASETFTGILDDALVARIDAGFGDMEAAAAESLRRDFGADDVFFERKAEMRYRGQRHNIHVPITGLRNVSEIREAFEHDYKRRYGHADSKAPTELQALHLSAFARLRRPDIANLRRKAAAGTALEQQSRLVHFDGVGNALETDIYDRDALEPGFAAQGPAVIEEYGSTTLIWPGDRFEIGEMGEIRVTCT